MSAFIEVWKIYKTDENEKHNCFINSIWACFCDGDLMPDFYVDQLNSTCDQIEVWASFGFLGQCNSTNMEFARSQCCESQRNLIFLHKKKQTKKSIASSS